MASKQARYIAAQCWCDEATKTTEMDSELAEAFAQRLDGLLEAIELAWGLIANSYGGDWELAAPEWRNAAEQWRDNHWHGPRQEKADATVDPEGTQEDALED